MRRYDHGNGRGHRTTTFLFERLTVFAVRIIERDHFTYTMANATPPIREPRFNLYADQGDGIRASNIAFIIIPTVFVILRLVSRKISRAGYGHGQKRHTDMFALHQWEYVSSEPILPLLDQFLSLENCVGIFWLWKNNSRHQTARQVGSTDGEVL